MAKKRKNGKNDNPIDYITLPQINLHPDIKRGIFVVFILAFGGVSLLSLFNLSGVVGNFLSDGMLAAFGWGRWVFPIVLLGLGFLLYSENRNKLRGANYLGLFLFLISFQALLHLLVAVNMYFSDSGFSINGAQLEEWKSSVSKGVGGGYAGMYLASVFLKLLGLWASLLVDVGLFLVSLMLLFNTTLANLIGRGSWFAKIIYFINLIFNKIFTKFKNVREDLETRENGIEDEFPETEDLIAETLPEEIGFASKKITARAGRKKDAGENGEKTAPINFPAGKETMDVAKQSHVKIDLPLDLLSAKVGKPTSGDIKGNTEIIKRTLENFGIPVEMGDVSVGPTVTQYTFKPAEGVKLSRITTLNNDLALSLAAHPIRIEAPIPGKSLVGIEVPNQTKAIVGLKEILSDDSFKARKTNLMVALGKDVSGKAWLDDLSKMPHLLVAGATNSGKSVCLNSIIVSLLYQNNPDDLKFIMVDPKKVELPVYNGIPHLFTPVITEVSKTINALKWCLNEMDRRFELLAKKGKRNIQGFNQSASEDEKMPYIVFIIDELADLMVVAARDVEPNIIRLAQMARAVGIHLILATQRPSVNVITGVIKANMPARIAFSVASGIDSRTILDSLGAEKLLGRGDMLFSTAETPKPKRLQGAFVSEGEIKRIVEYIKEKSGGPNYAEGITERQKVSGIGGVGLNGGGDDDDDLLAEAKEMVINSGKASASYLQRRLSIGYARAARLLDLLEEAGVVTGSNGAKPREILISKEEYDNVINQGVSGVSLHNREESEAPESYLISDSDDSGEEDEDDFKEDIIEDEEIKEEVEEIEENEDTPVHAEVQESNLPRRQAGKTKKLSDAKVMAGKQESTSKNYNDLEEEGKFFSR